MNEQKDLWFYWVEKCNNYIPRLKIILPFLIGLFLVLPLGVPSVLATITEVKTECNLFDCYTDLKTDFVVDNKYLTGNKYDIKDLPNTELIKHIGNIKDFKIKFIDKNNVRVYGNIRGASKNRWGLKLFDDTSFSGSTWWNSSYDMCLDLSVDYEIITGPFEDFPVLVVLNSSRINYTLTQDNGEDIRFVNASCDNNGDLLNHEIENWNETEDSNIWVKLEDVLAEDYTNFSMYYNNSNAIDGQNIPGVWNSKFKGVFHLTSNDNSQLIDSTSNDHDSSTNTLDSSTGRIWKGMNGNDSEYANFGDVNDWDWGVDAFTLETWYKGTEDFYGGIVSKIQESSTPGWALLIPASGKAEFFYRAGDADTHSVLSDDIINNDEWHYIVSVRSSGGYATMYIDGELQTDNETSSLDVSNSFNSLFGRYYSDTNNYYLDGDIDEYRLSNVELSSGWINATYLSNTDQLLIYGDSIEQPPSTTTTTTVLPVGRYDYLDTIDYELWTYGAIVLMFAIIFFLYI